MKFFEDLKIKKIARDEDIKAPDKYLKCVEQTLNDLKNNNRIDHNHSLFSQSDFPLISVCTPQAAGILSGLCGVLFYGA